MERKVKVCFTRDRCSCNACSARNYESALTPQIGRRVDALYEVHIGQLVSVLCEDCLDTLRTEIDVIVFGT